MFACLASVDACFLLSFGFSSLVFASLYLCRWLFFNVILLDSFACLLVLVMFSACLLLVFYCHIGACLFLVISTPVCDAFACFSWLCWCFSCFVTHPRIRAYFGKIKLTLDLLPVSNYGDSESVVSMLAYCCRVARLRCFFFWCLYRCLLKLTYRCSVISVLLAELHTFAWYENKMHSNAIDLYHYSWFFPLSTIIFCS